MYYHRLTLRTATGHVTDKVLGSAANTIDDAARERSRIAAQYNPHQIIALTTHNQRNPLDHP